MKSIFRHLSPGRPVTLFTFLASFFVALTAAITMTVSVSMAAPPSPRNIMAEVYESIAYLLPLSVRDYEAETTWDAELIETAVGRLRGAGQALREHAQGEDAEFQLIARSFDRTVEDIELAFSGGLPSYAYFLMMDLTQYCAACHSRAPAETAEIFGQKLLARVDTRVFEEEELARLYIALRQFDKALSTYEKLLLDAETGPIDADLQGLFIEYLTLNLTTEDDFERAREFFSNILGRSDLPYYLARRFETWNAIMDGLEGALGLTPSLAGAEMFFEQAKRMKRVPYDRRGAVQDIIAARQLRELVQSGALKNPNDLHEAYYLLGLIHLRTLEPRPAVPEMEMLFEAAIRSAPDGRYAADAYALLEEFGYVEEDLLAYAARESGVGPRRPMIDMAELRGLIENGQ